MKYLKSKRCAKPVQITLTFQERSKLEELAEKNGIPVATMAYVLLRQVLEKQQNPMTSNDFQ